MSEGTEETEEIRIEPSSSKFKLSLTDTGKPTGFEYESSVRHFNDKLRAASSLIPEIMGELTGVSAPSEEEEDLHNYVVTSTDILGKLVFEFTDLAEFRFAAKCSSTFDGIVVAEYQAVDLSWIALSTITGTGSDVLESIGDAAMLKGDDQSNGPVFPFSIRVRVSLACSVGSCSVWVAT